MQHQILILFFLTEGQAGSAAAATWMGVHVGCCVHNVQHILVWCGKGVQRQCTCCEFTGCCSGCGEKLGVVAMCGTSWFGEGRQRQCRVMSASAEVLQDARAWRMMV